MIKEGTKQFMIDNGDTTDASLETDVTKFLITWKHKL